MKELTTVGRQARVRQGREAWDFTDEFLDDEEFEDDDNNNVE
ncbi:MAG: hypothetical protein WAZ77_17800 [Candidatus Nitrosopolaris sp.]|jgi:hypothetical protein